MSEIIVATAIEFQKFTTFASGNAAFLAKLCAFSPVSCGVYPAWKTSVLSGTK